MKKFLTKKFKKMRKIVSFSASPILLERIKIISNGFSKKYNIKQTRSSSIEGIINYFYEKCKKMY